MARTGSGAKAATITTTPFDVGAWIKKEDQKRPGFAAAVEAELAALRLEERLRQLRTSQHVTQSQLARRMGISQSAVAQIEQTDDPGGMAIRTVAKMATALGYGLHIEFKRLDVQASAIATKAPRRVARKPAKR